MMNTFSTPILVHAPWQVTYPITEYGKATPEVRELMVKAAAHVKVGASPLTHGLRRLGPNKLMVTTLPGANIPAFMKKKVRRREVFWPSMFLMARSTKGVLTRSTAQISTLLVVSVSQGRDARKSMSLFIASSILRRSSSMHIFKSINPTLL